MGLFRTFESGEHKKIKSHFENLVAVALSDGVIDEKEKEYLLSLAQNYSITEEEIMHIIENPDHYVFTAPVDKAERQKQLKEIIRLLLADGKVTQSEINICKKMAVALNYNPSIVVRITNLLQKYMDRPFDLYGILSEIDDIIE
ncbi:MAG TPA: hypothetical protein P5050_02200 [Bacteroidia bacterium]|nr:TerB family tellurite resistance protein [Sphingobacteriales bacterium]HPD64272.1 hypothetical protein [Bacteroidia bacterium]HRS58013.1 hypothetical protein [Bacteroidia bacterium]HRU69190.1 hypothetical protein [Bacteroidia bacterium]